MVYRVNVIMQTTATKLVFVGTDLYAVTAKKFKLVKDDVWQVPESAEQEWKNDPESWPCLNPEIDADTGEPIDDGYKVGDYVTDGEFFDLWSYDYSPIANPLNDVPRLELETYRDRKTGEWGTETAAERITRFISDGE